MKKIFLIILLSIFTSPVYAYEDYTPSLYEEYEDYGYVIDAYDVYIIVNENNVLEITETITANFLEERHGIKRTIPISNEVERLDGTKEVNRVEITDIDVDNEFTTYKESGNYVIQIGNEDKVITGEETYTITYKYNLGKDKTKDYDELYFNIIGNEWDTAIGNVTFTIEMPKEFDEELLGFSSGKKGELNSDNVYYEVYENIIIGNYIGILDKEEGVTIRLELEDGYFTGAKLNVGLSTYLMYIIPIVSLIGAAIIWFLYGRDKEVIETVEFYPPEGFNSLEVGYLYKGSADKKDVTSLMIYLANKGYLKISELKEKSLFSKTNSFKITKLKDYNGTNANERTFLNGLFKNKDEVTESDLKDEFYTTTNEIIHNINSEKENKEKIFVSNKYQKITVMGLIIAAFIFTIYAPTVEYGGIDSLFSTIILGAVYLAFIAVGLFLIRSVLPKIFWIGFTILHGFLFFRALPISYALREPIFLYGVLIGIACLLGVCFFYKYLPKRTDYGIEMLGKIKGFKNFLETAEKDKLEAMVLKEPTYFYDILPYTYILGVSNKWIKKFESISIEPPTWYETDDAFDVVVFSSFMDNTMRNAEKVMSSSPTSSSDSGSSSGGGSSGGGSGGGGGSSW